MLIFLKDIDREFAGQQFIIYKKLFLQDRLGLTGIREYPTNATATGSGDIDSGPVVLDFGSAATLTGMHTLSLYGDHALSLRIRNQIEAFGFPTRSSENQKRYLLGKLPMADAFITWGHSAGNISEHHKTRFVLFHFYSLLAVGILTLCIWVMWRK